VSRSVPARIQLNFTCPPRMTDRMVAMIAAAV
jgi:hypothetical protein